MFAPNKLRKYFAFCAIIVTSVHAQTAQEPFFRFQEPEPIKQAQPVVSRPPPIALALDPNAPTTMEINRTTNNRFVVRGYINNKINSVTFDLDTGIRKFVISERIATSDIKRNCKQTVIGTANGYVNGCEAILKEIKFGYFKLLNVPVLILKGLERNAIIGMDILGLFDVHTDNHKITIGPKNSLITQQSRQSHQRFNEQNNSQPLQQSQPVYINQRDYSLQQQTEPYVQPDRRIVSRKEDIKYANIKSAAETEFDNFLKKTLLTIYVDRYLILKIISGLIVLRIFMGLMMAYMQNKERKNRNYPY